MQGNTGTPMGIGGQVAQKIMLMKALQGMQPQSITQAIPNAVQANPMAPPNPVPGMQNV
jgi:hypothetical protein